MATPTPPASSPAVRRFGRFQLLRLLGKSERTMAWLVADPRSGQDLMLVLPRAQPAGADALERCVQGVRKAARLNHPNIAPAVDVGVHENWPYVAYDPSEAATLRDRLPTKGMPATEAAALMLDTLQGLAYAHEAGIAHQDLQPYLLLVGDSGTLRLTGLELGCEPAHKPGAAAPLSEARGQRAQQEIAQRDVLSLGVLMHEMLTGKPVLDEPDAGRVLQRLPPLGRDIARLAWDTPQPIPEPLRAIVNRATDRQERQRYRGARTLAHALEGWLKTAAANSGGPLALLLDRLRVVGVLPSSPGAAQRALRLTTMERQRTNELAEVVLQDMALAFEMLRAVNTAQVHGAQVSGDGPVLTVRRAIAMMGMEGVRRAALVLRPWPGPLAEAAAADLETLMERVKRAGRVAVALRPAGYDSEVVYLVTLLQNLGRLVVHYHFSDDAVQIRRLMMPAPPQRPGESEEPGMSEEGASFAVLGADIESIGAAVARHWGLDDSVLHMVRRLPVATPVRGVEGDDELLRATASCANEVIDALALPAPQVTLALHRVVQRYGRALDLTLKDLEAALQPPVADNISMASGLMDLDPLPPAAAGGQRAAAARTGR